MTEPTAAASEEPSASPRGVWDRLKEHKVLQWGLAYLGAALALAHGAELLGHTFHWPEIALRLIMGALIVGLPLALTLAWYHGHKGLKGVSQGELTIASILLVIAAGLLFVLVRTPADDAPASLAASPATMPDPLPGVSLAVLPFADMSLGHDQDYFSDGLTEEILNQLAQISALRVTGRTSSFSFKGKNEDLRVISATLGVANLLEGSVRKDGNELRITAQLVNGKDGTHLWSKTYDRELSKVFALQEEIAKDVAHALSVKLDVGESSLAQGGTTNVEAYDKYLRAQGLFTRGSPSTLQQAAQLYREAVALDPGFFQAWASLHGMLPPLAVNFPENAAALMEERAAIAARLKTLPANGVAAELFHINQAREAHQWAQAMAAIGALQVSAPTAQGVTYMHAFLLHSVGRVSASVPYYQRLIQADPLSIAASVSLFQALYTTGRRAEADAEYARAMTLVSSSDEKAALEMQRPIVDSGDPAAIKAALKSILQLRGTRTGTRAPPLLAALAESVDDTTAFRAVLRQAFEDPASRTEGGMAVIAELAVLDHDKDLALDALRRLFVDLHGGFTVALWSPDPNMRADPRFKALLRDMGLVDYFRTSGQWGDFCKPIGKDDFECH
jgi:TolB-like protein